MDLLPRRRFGPASKGILNLLYHKQYGLAVKENASKGVQSSDLANRPGIGDSETYRRIGFVELQGGSAKSRPNASKKGSRGGSSSHHYLMFSVNYRYIPFDERDYLKWEYGCCIRNTLWGPEDYARDTGVSFYFRMATEYVLTSRSKKCFCLKTDFVDEVFRWS